MDNLKKELISANLDLDDKKIVLLSKFKDLVLEKNKVLNLTAITDEKSFILKHIIDSLSVLQAIHKDAKNLIDIGTGAGFPGIPLKIARPEINVTLLDSSKKKISFLNEAIGALCLKNISSVAERAEALNKDRKFYGKFDVAVARAVAFLPVLCEYCLPFVKVGGIFIAQKSKNDDEIKASEEAIQQFGGKIKEIIPIKISDLSERCLVVIEKIS